MNRRQLLTTTGAVASLGLCVGIVAGVPGCTPAPAATHMQEVIERYRAASEAYAAAAHANDVVNHPNDETETAFADADVALDEALDALLRCRPNDLSEATDRIEFLFSFDGPWHVFHPSKDEVALFLGSMREA